MTLGEMGLIRQIPRQPGQKESRFVHLLSGEPDITSSQGEDAPTVVVREEGSGTGGRLEALEEETRTLREELDALKQSFNDFKSQFE